MAEKKLQDKTGLLWSSHVGTFREFLLTIPSRRTEVILISELGAIGNSSQSKILLWESVVKEKLGII